MSGEKITVEHNANDSGQVAHYVTAVDGSGCTVYAESVLAPTPVEWERAESAGVDFELACDLQDRIAAARHRASQRLAAIDDLAAQITATPRGNGRYAVAITGETVEYSRKQIEVYLDQTIGPRGNDDGHGDLRRAVLVAMDRADAAADRLDETCWLP